MSSTSLTDFRNQYLTQMTARLKAVDLAAASSTDLVLNAAMMRAFDSVNQIDTLGPGALSLLGSMTAVDFETWIEDVSNRAVFQEILASITAMNAVAASATAMTQVAASATAMTQVAASATAMTQVAASATAMTQVAASATAMTQVIGNAAALAQVVASATAMTQVAASATAMTQVAASATAMTQVAASATAKMACYKSDTALTAILAASTAMTAMRAASGYMATAGFQVAGADTPVSIPGLANGATYIALGISSSNATVFHTVTLSTKRSGSSVSASGFTVATLASIPTTRSMAVPLTTPMLASNTGGGYTWFVGLIRCDI